MIVGAKLFRKSADDWVHYLTALPTQYPQVTGQIREGMNQELRRMIVREVPRPECRLLYGNDYRLQHDHICLQSVVKGVALCAVSPVSTYLCYLMIRLLT